ncbi:MAG: alpha-N-acetylglucosaminidase [Bacteroidales bacterium]|jgi:alpha-N-acetylglucosaminidase|nr:alpha-N-acetylglucosaminidase [Bacteroidales bacterium]
MKKTVSLVYVMMLVFGAVNNMYSTPVDDFLNRIGGEGTAQRFITEVKPTGDGQDYFTITSENGKPKIIGNSYLSITTGIGWYLKYHAGVSLSWNNLTTDLTKIELPVHPEPVMPITCSTNLNYRYYLNYCTYSYSMAFWDWERWQKEIDWMALHGVNMPLALIGTEVVWYNILTKHLGYTKDEANAFVAGPAYQAWFLMNNLEGWGGANPDSWYKRQENLQKNILSRMHELGMKPVLAGYSGMVPHDIGSKKGWSITSSNKWCNFTRPEFLRTTEPQFNEIAKLYYDEMKDLYGVSEYYSMDLFHEGGVPAGTDVGQAHKDIYTAMKTYSGAANPKWLIQAWGANPRQQGLDALDSSQLIVLDLFSDGKRRWENSYKRTDGMPHKFMFCMLHNFGGRSGLHGRMAKTIDEFYRAKEQYPNTLLGVGATMEAIENNPVVYELLYELPWRPNKFEASEWVTAYSAARYGGSEINKSAAQAWALLNGSIYNCLDLQEGTTESVLCARPALAVNRVSTWGTTKIYWNTQDVRDAAALLLSQHNTLSGVNYDYDVVDVVRQTLADYAHQLLDSIKSAHENNLIQQRNAHIDTFMNVLLDQDRLLNTIPDFMVGTWIAGARKMGNTDTEKNLYEKNARMLITTWGDRQQANGGGLHDYSYREWGGLMKDYYYPRWKLFFDRLKANAPTPSADDFFDMEWAWAMTNSAIKTYPTAPQENPVVVAKEVFEKYFP